ncbi:glycoside hydrolase family 78 protein [Nibrella saemangeumensis]|uniref:alpha-L-rhamnosidase n=1 Tax=Nibrella saemangeumensis TaxID=1084526 RepID=A0ABP8NIL0_9BACT
MPVNPATLLAVLLYGWYSILPTVTWAAPGLQPGHLTCEYVQNPFLDVHKPRLSWTLTSPRRNERQTAYELLVSETLADINRPRGTVWQSGKVLSGQNLHIDYAGPPLKPFTRYYWRVRVYDAGGQASAWSPPAWFETAMLQPADWQAQWIGDGSKQFARDEDFYQPDPMPLFRRVFSPRKKVASARLYISGLGYYEAYLNGQKVGDHVLDPGWTTYRKQVQYVVYDITPQIRPGQNVAGIMLGNGWYNPLPLRLFGRFNLRDVQQTGRPCVKAQIRLHYTDGSTELIATDESWQTAPGPVMRNNVYLGEAYDARREPASWTTPNTNPTGWKPAVRTEGPSGELSVQMQPPIRVTKVLKPVRMTEPKPGVFLFDMGQNFAGVARIRVQGPAGTQINLRYGEDIHPDGTLNYLTTVAGQIKEIWNLKGGPGAPKTAWQEDHYTLKGEGLETWSPRFTFHGFRYVEVTGWPGGKPTLESVDGLRMNADLPDNGEFACSNEMLTRLNEVIKWTFLSNVFSVQSDCPGREKMGYGADIVTTSEAFIYNFDMANFYRKSVRDYRNDQQADGGITEIAPYTGIADRGLGGESGPLGWQLAFPYVQKQLYDFYGDRRIIEDNYEAFARQIAFLRSKADRNLFHWDISDHEALDPRPEAFSASVFYLHHVQLAVVFAGILGKTADSTEYAKLAETVRKAIVRQYLVPKTGRFDNGTQSAQALALWYGISPEKEASFQALADEIDRHNGHISAGIFGTKMLFDVMRRQDRNDLAYRVANQRDFPGWGYMLSKGATTLWETWAYPDNAPSQNHPMFGSISEWFYRSLLGINAAAPGFARIQIKPQPTGDLTWAKGSYHSVRGPIGSNWKREGERFTLQVSIPANTTAEIWIPAMPGTTITESGKPVSSVPGLRPLRQENGYAVFESGSGTYTFNSALQE